MKLTQGQSDFEVQRSGKWMGVSIAANLVAAAINTPITPAMFDKTGVQVICTLKRNGNIYTIFNNNLKLLGTHKMRKSNWYTFNNGMILTPGAGGAIANYLQVCNLDFGGILAPSAGDELVCQVQFNAGFNASINTASSFLDVVFTPGIGAETGIPATKIEVVQTNADQGNFVNANGVRKIQFLNFDQTTWVTPVVQNIGLQSDKLQYSATLLQAIAADQMKYPSNINYQYGATQQTATVVRTLDALPQCFSIYEAQAPLAVLNQCQVTMNFFSANVAASQNWVASDTVYIDAKTASAIAAR